MAVVTEPSVGQSAKRSRVAPGPVAWLPPCQLRLLSAPMLPNGSVPDLRPAQQSQARPIGSAAAAPAQPASVSLPQAEEQLVAGGPPQARTLRKASGSPAPQRLSPPPA